MGNPNPILISPLKCTMSQLSKDPKSKHLCAFIQKKPSQNQIQLVRVISKILQNKSIELNYLLSKQISKKAGFVQPCLNYNNLEIDLNQSCYIEIYFLSCLKKIILQKNDCGSRGHTVPIILFCLILLFLLVMQRRNKQ